MQSVIRIHSPFPIQVSESDLREPRTPTSSTHEHTTISEEGEDVATPLPSDRSLTHPLPQEVGQEDEVVVQVIKATKRLLESIRLRDFDAYK